MRRNRLLGLLLAGLTTWLCLCSSSFILIWKLNIEFQTDTRSIQISSTPLVSDVQNAIDYIRQAIRNYVGIIGEVKIAFVVAEFRCVQSKCDPLYVVGHVMSSNRFYPPFIEPIYCESIFEVDFRTSKVEVSSNAPPHQLSYYPKPMDITKAIETALAQVAATSEGKVYMESGQPYRIWSRWGDSFLIEEASYAQWEVNIHFQGKTIELRIENVPTD